MTRGEVEALVPENFDVCSLRTDWDKLYGARSHLHQRWEDYAGWTLPYLYPIDEVTSTTEMQLDYQSTGAQAVNHLSNKITSTLFAPSRPFFRIELDQDQLAEAIASGIEEADVEELTAATEKKAMKQLEKVGLRTALLQTMRSLITTGNSLLFFPPNKDKAQVYSLKDYVIKRDMSGCMTHLITRDTHAVATLPPELQDLVGMKGITDPLEEVTIYTGVMRVSKDVYLVKQEIDDLFVLPGARGVYSTNTLPWIPLTWNLVRGYDYGTGLVEDYAGAFSSLSAYAESMRDLAAIATDIKGLVNPMGSTDVDSLNNSDAGTWVYGHPDDIAYLNLEKVADLQFLASAVEQTKQEIGRAFLLNSAVTRDAERVTAQEIQMQANELEESLGGVYSRLAEELQQPLARRLLDSLDGSMRDLDVSILTGVEALSRTSDLDQIMMMFNDIAMLQNLPEAMLIEMDLQNVVKVLGSHRHVDYTPFLKSEETKARERQQRLQEQEQMMAMEAAATQQQVT